MWPWSACCTALRHPGGTLGYTLRRTGALPFRDAGNGTVHAAVAGSVVPVQFGSLCVCWIDGGRKVCGLWCRAEQAWQQVLSDAPSLAMQPGSELSIIRPRARDSLAAMAPLLRCGSARCLRGKYSPHVL